MNHMLDILQLLNKKTPLKLNGVLIYSRKK